MVELGRIFWCRLLGWVSAKGGRFENCWGIMDIVRMILWTSKGGIERRILTEVEKRFFGGNCSLDGMYN